MGSGRSRARSMGVRSGSWLGFRGPDRKDEALGLRIERTADLLGHLDMLLHTAAGDQSRVQLGDDFGQGQGNQHAIAVVARSENVRRCHTQFAERDFNRPARELREDFFQGDRDARIADVGVLDARLEFERKVAQDGLKRQFDALAGLVKAIAIELGREDCVTMAWP